MMAVPRHGAVSLPPLARYRYQLPLVVLICAGLPSVLVGGLQAFNPFALTAVSNAFFGSLMSAIVGLSLFRRFGGFPGITSLGQVAPAVVAPFVVVDLLILATRVNYSRPILFASAVLAAATFLALWFYTRRNCAPTIHALPGAQIQAKQARVYPLDYKTPVHALGRNPIIVANLRDEMSARWQDYLLRAALAGIPVYHVKQLDESLTGRVRIDHLSENSFGSLSPNQLYVRFKRLIDLLAGIAALPFLALLVVIVGIAIKLDSPGPIFFVQTRQGYRGQVFRLFKFRTMRSEEALDGCREQAKTLDGDRRVTRLGRFLRRYRIDELPQILNIIRGEMSWIGPRPEAVALSDWYESEIGFYGYRHMVRPGITGWAQVHQGHVHDLASVREKLEYDFYYIKYFSVWLDLLIVLRTGRTLLVGNGAR